MSRNFRSGITSKLCKMYDQAVSAIDIVTRPYSRIVNTRIVKCREEKEKKNVVLQTEPQNDSIQFDENGWEKMKYLTFNIDPRPASTTSSSSNHHHHFCVILHIAMNSDTERKKKTQQY